MKLRRALLVCGVLSSLVYVGIDQLAAVRYGGYHSFTTQTISELGARGAPDESQWSTRCSSCTTCSRSRSASASGRRRAGRRALRVTGAMLIALGAGGLPGPWLFPMNLRGVGGDAPHIVATGVMVLFIAAAIVSGAFARGRGVSFLFVRDGAGDARVRFADQRAGEGARDRRADALDRADRAGLHRRLPALGRGAGAGAAARGGDRHHDVAGAR